MKKGICVAGNLIVDITYPIEKWPNQGELVTITEGITRSVGGAVCNDIVDLAKLDPTMPLTALGVIGTDAEGDFILEELGKCKNIDLSNLKREGITSFTSVMSNNDTKARTFFHYRGTNARFDESYIDWEKLDCDIFHIGYILLLDALDAEDPEYGTKMARLLANAQKKGLKTSIDVVSESGNRFKKIVSPALRYTDYCVINEIEAQQITGVKLRDEDEKLYPENMEEALRAIKALGVSTWAVIHCPEGSWGLDEKDEFFFSPSLKVPKDDIKGTVGAGDAFCSGVIYGAWKGWTLAESVRLATCSAVAALSERGATEGLREIAEVMKFEEKYGYRS
ncbi:MAG: carbohydrate kinase family protein [Oscillospiraceae bacterium]|nr:carbohydrate kinase family protein [Oscillospiraceae bacterium]